MMRVLKPIIKVPELENHGIADRSYYRGQMSLEVLISHQMATMSSFMSLLISWMKKILLWMVYTILRDNTDYKEWAKILSREYKSLSIRVKHGTNTVLDEYGTKSPPEFFCCSNRIVF